MLLLRRSGVGLGEGMSSVVFISHSLEDRGIAGEVCAALERRGVGCWLVSRDIGPGESFRDATVAAIRGARAVVLVFTGNTDTSSEIRSEIALANRNRLAVVALRVEDLPPSEALARELSTAQWIDAFDDWERAIDRLADRIGVLAGEERAAPPVAGASQRAASWPRNRGMVWFAAGLAGLVVAGGFAFRIGGGRAVAVPTPAAPAIAAAPPAAAAPADIAGRWVAEAPVNPDDGDAASTLLFDFEQSGVTLFGTLSEKTALGGAIGSIQGGQVKGDALTFYMQGPAASDSGEPPSKELYRGSLKDGEIAFVRQNDAAPGGPPQTFTATRE